MLLAARVGGVLCCLYTLEYIFNTLRHSELKELAHRWSHWWLEMPWVQPKMPAGTEKTSCKDGKTAMESSSAGASSQKTHLLDTCPSLAPLEIK